MTHLFQSRVMEVLGEVIDTPSARRESLLASLCGSDAALRAEVERLLALEAQAASAMPDTLDAGKCLSVLSEIIDSASLQSPVHLIPTGTIVGAYRFEKLLGQGGMGVVYRGTDTRLDRPVAIKSLPPSLARDASRLSRFIREAKLLSSLSHPNVATVFGLEETNDAKYLVMELIDGESLADRLARGAMPIPEALSVAIQIASGLRCAHEAGVVHRDLKPANVMLAPDGKVKLLDFGLAREVRKSLVDDPSSASGKDSDGVVTREGSVVGTPRFMSPEQVRGLPVDERTDVFAFGCVFYEMLTGVPAFQGNDPLEIAAAILERQPDFSSLPPRTPEAVRRVLRRSLTKDIHQRLRDLGDVRIELEEVLAERAWLSENQPARELAGAPSRWTTYASALAILGLAALVAWLLLDRRAPPPAVPTVASERFAVPFPNNVPQTDLSHIRIAISRDGRHVVLSARDGQHLGLWRRTRGDTQFTAIPATSNAWIPQLSPDGEWLAYFLNGKVFKRRLAGGNPIPVLTHTTYAGRFSWDADNSISFAPYWGKGIARASAAGGEPQFVTEPDFQQQEFGHFSPVLTPGGDFILYTNWNGDRDTRIDAVKLDGKVHHNVVENGQSPRIVTTPFGVYLLYGRLGTIFAAPFDAERCLRTGPETAIVDGVLADRALFDHCYDVADDGTLAYVPGPMFTEESRLAWVNDDGSTTPINDDRLSFAEPNFSSDGKKLSVVIKGEVYRPHLYDFDKGTLQRLVSDCDTESAAISPDGKYVAYSCNRDGPFSLWLRNLEDGSEKKLTSGNPDYQIEIAWSPDSKRIAYATSPDLHSSRGIWVVEVDGGEPRRFCDRPAEDRAPQFSPDGRWIAYSSEETDTREVRIRRFPDGAVDRLVCPDGADWPHWSPNGEVLYYLQDGQLWSVPMSKTGAPAGRATLVYGKGFGQSDYELGDYTIAPDGRILLVEPSERSPRVAAVHIILRWFDLLHR